jgi:hypothetical protein
VPGDRGVEADLGLVEPEAVLAELEAFFGWLIISMARPRLTPASTAC